MTTPVPPRKSNRIRRFLVVAFFLAIVALIGYHLYAEYELRSRYDPFFASLDARDPRWRFDDVCADRAEVADEGNSFTLLRDAYEAMPKLFKWNDEADEAVRDLKLPARLTPAARRACDGELGKAARALPLARRLAEMPQGRHQLTLAENPLRTILATHDYCYPVSRHLHLDSAVAADEGRIADALRSAAAIVNVGRSLGDEPFVVSQKLRASCVLTGVKAAIHAWSQGDADDAALAAFQRLLADEEAFDAVSLSARAERASTDRHWREVLAGRVRFEELTLCGCLSPESIPPETFIDRLRRYSNRQLREWHLADVSVKDKLVAISSLPSHEQFAAEAALEAETKDMPLEKRALTANVEAIRLCHGAFRRVRAQCAAARALLAAERYRLKRLTYPPTLDALVPTYLAAVPTDPRTAEKIRYAVTATGAKVWAVAPGVAPPSSTDRRDVSDEVAFELWLPHLRGLKP